MIRPVAMAIALVAFVSAAGMVGYVFFWPHGAAGAPRAVIVDQLASTDPNPEFVDHATTMLRAAGYDVDYVPPDQVTVEFYRKLPRHGYRLVIVRSHASQERKRHVEAGPGRAATGYTVSEKVVGLFTNERFDQTTHVEELRDFQLSGSSYPDFPERGAFFGINPEFVQRGMSGNFRGATVILMGCGGLNSTGMAQALVDRGVSRLVSWSDLVTAEHTDRATEQFLRQWLDGNDADGSVTRTMDEVGADPAFGSMLLAFP